MKIIEEILREFNDSLATLTFPFKKKVTFCINAISGIDGLIPTLDMIPFSKNILIANKESIICGWKFINNKFYC